MDLRVWIRDVAVFFLFMTAVQNIAPRQYRGTIRFVLGLLMLLVLGRPLFQAGHLEETFLTSLGQLTLEETAESLGDGQKLFDGFQEDYLYDAYERELESQIRQYLAGRGIADARVEAELAGTERASISELRLCVSAADGERGQLAEKLQAAKKELSDVYQLDPRHIIVEIQE